MPRSDLHTGTTIFPLVWICGFALVVGASLGTLPYPWMFPTSFGLPGNMVYPERNRAVRSTHVSEAIRYSRDQLFAFRGSVRNSILHETLVVLKLNGILRFRGKRAGRRNASLNATNSLENLHHKIPVVRPRKRYKALSLRQVDWSSLISIRRLQLRQCLPSVTFPDAQTACAPQTLLGASLTLNGR